MSTIMLDLFVAHGGQSERELRGLLEDLAALGDTAWLGPQPSGGGARWGQALARIRACDAFLFTATSRTSSSEACLRLMRYAHALDKPLIVVELGEGRGPEPLPVTLVGAPVVSYHRRDREAALSLCRALRPLTRARPLPVVLPALPAPPPPDFVSLRERIAAPGKLDAHQQLALIADLVRDSRDLEAAGECRQLLLLLRRRRDLPASLVHEIDQLLRKTAATRINLRRSPALASGDTGLSPPRARPRRRAPAPQAGLGRRALSRARALATARPLGALCALALALAAALAWRAPHEGPLAGSPGSAARALGAGELGLADGELGAWLGAGAGLLLAVSLVHQVAVRRRAVPGRGH